MMHLNSLPGFQHIDSPENVPEFQHVSLYEFMILGVLSSVGFWLIQEDLSATLSIIRNYQTIIQPSILAVFQYLCVAIDEVFKLHDGWFRFQTEPSNDLITEGNALGYCFKIILHTHGDVLICTLVAEVLGNAQNTLSDCDLLEAALKQVKFHGDEVFLVLVPFTIEGRAPS